jgi:hypothetical protein
MPRYAGVANEKDMGYNNKNVRGIAVSNLCHRTNDKSGRSFS